LGKICGIINIDIWGPKSNDYSRKEALKPYAVIFSY